MIKYNSPADIPEEDMKQYMLDSCRAVMYNTPIQTHICLATACGSSCVGCPYFAYVQRLCGGQVHKFFVSSNLAQVEQLYATLTGADKLKELFA